MICIVNGYPTGPPVTTISEPKSCGSTSQAIPSTSTGVTSSSNTQNEPLDPMRLRINEIGFGPNGFLEFDSHTVHENILNPSCVNMPLKNIDFKNYQVVVAKRRHTKYNRHRTIKIQAIIDLSKMSLQANQYLVLHSKEIQNSQFSVSNVLKESIGSNSQSGNTRFPSGKTPENFLDMDDTDTLMIILLYGDVGPLKLQPFNEEILESWVPFMADAVIFGGSHSQMPYNALKILTKSDKRKMKHRNDLSNLYSFSKCSVSFAPFKSDAFRDTNLTPGQDNDCSCLNANTKTLENFYAELDRVEELVEELDDYSTIIARNTEIPYVGEGQEAGECLMEDISRNMGPSDLFINRENGRKRQLMERYRDPTKPLFDHTYSKAWQSTYTSYEDYQHMQQNHDDKYRVNWIRDYYSWIAYLKETGNIRCGPCNKYSKSARIKPLDMTKMSKDEGIRHDDWASNKKEIKTHEKSSQHIYIKQWIKSLNEMNIQEDEYPLMIMPNAHGYDVANPVNPGSMYKAYIVTARMVRTVYLETKLNIPYVAHEDMVNMQKLNEINMGYHHYSIQGAIQIQNFLSTEMHKRFVGHIIDSNTPVSIIVDDTTHEKIHVMAVLLQVLEDSEPRVHFYRWIPFEGDESAEAHFEKLKEAFEEDGLIDNLKGDDY